MLQTELLPCVIQAQIHVCCLEQAELQLWCCCCRVAELLGGKGAGKRGHFQGKAAKMSRRGEVQALLQEFISHQNPGA